MKFEKIKKCSHCHTGKILSEFYRDKYQKDGYKNMCKDCCYLYGTKHREDRVIWNHDHKERVYKSVSLWNKNNSIKTRARSLINEAIRWGRLVKEPCEICGSLDVHGHHPDYTKPLEVSWLCAEHHKQIHGYRNLNQYEI